jgi:hypothetical protein
MFSMSLPRLDLTTFDSSNHLHDLDDTTDQAAYAVDSFLGLFRRDRHCFSTSRTKALCF